MKYVIRRDERGKRLGGLEVADESTPLQDEKPNSVTLSGAEHEMIECIVCSEAEDSKSPRLYKLPAIAANHFKKAHPDLYEDRDSWRQHVRKVCIRYEE